MAKPAISACAWRIEHVDLVRPGFTTSFEEVMRWAGLGAVVIPLPISRPSVVSKPVEMVPVGELSRRAQVSPLRVLSPVDVAACAARWFSAAGSHIAFPACPTDVAREQGSARAGFLAAAMELRDLLAQSSDGRQALGDLGFKPTCGGEGRGT